MIGYHAVPVIADAYLKGIRGYDAEAALTAMVASASYGPYGGLRQYMQLGYVPIDKEGEAASKTLEYAFDDWSLARMAQAMGRAELAAAFMKRAANWRNAFDPATGFMRARRRDGSFREPFDPSASGYGTDYTEGNAWQYSWYVPQDVAGLAQAHGGDAAAAVTHRCGVRRQGRSQDLRAHGGRHRPHRLVRPRQRAESSHRLPVCRGRGAVAHPGAARAHHGQPVRAAPRRTGRQRRPGADVGVVPVHRARLLSGRARQQRVHHRSPVRWARARSTCPTASASP